MLAATLAEPTARWHLRGLARHLSLSPSTLQRELEGLVSAGVLSREEEGGRTYFRANSEGVVFQELRALMRKASMGTVQAVAESEDNESAMPMTNNGMQAWQL